MFENITDGLLFYPINAERQQLVTLQLLDVRLLDLVIGKIEDSMGSSVQIPSQVAMGWY